MDTNGCLGGLLGVLALIGTYFLLTALFGPAPSKDPSPQQQIRDNQEYWQQRQQEKDRETLERAANHLPPN